MQRKRDLEQRIRQRERETVFLEGRYAELCERAETLERELAQEIEHRVRLELELERRRAERAAAEAPSSAP